MPVGITATNDEQHDHQNCQHHHEENTQFGSAVQIKTANGQRPGTGNRKKIPVVYRQERQNQHRHAGHEGQGEFLQQHRKEQNDNSGVQTTQFLQGKLKPECLPQGQMSDGISEAAEGLESVMSIRQSKNNCTIRQIHKLQNSRQYKCQRQRNAHFCKYLIFGTPLLGQEHFVHPTGVFLAENWRQHHDQEQ